jgi:hypothetical protein
MVPYFLPQKISSQKCGLGIRDPEKIHSGSRGQKGTESRILPHWYTALTLEDLWMTGATTAVGFGAAFRWVRRSSVRPPRPIDVKKLIANLHNKR